MAVFIACGYGVVALLPVRSDLMFTAVKDKHQRLSSLQPPRIILVGGSNLALGIDSSALEQATGLPVVNMGLNGGLGLRFMCSEVAPALRDGDIVVLSPEFEHWRGALLDGDLNLLWVLRVYPEGVRYLSSYRQAWALARHAPEFMREQVAEMLSFQQDPVYNRLSFTEQGDFIGHLAEAPRRPLLGNSPLTKDAPNPETARVVRAFAEVAAGRTATVLYSFPPIARSAYLLEGNAAAVSDVYDQLRAIPGVVVVDRPDQHVFDDRAFFDSIYHLTPEGRRRRTEMVARELEVARAGSKRPG